MVQRNGKDEYLLMAGQRRLEALKKLGAKTIPVLVLDNDSACDIIDAKAVSVIENVHRKEMNPSDMTASCQFLVEKLGRADAARALGIKSSTLREHLGFSVVPGRIRKMVPKQISRRDAIRICRKVPSESRAEEIIQKIAKYDVAKKRRYIDALEHLGGSAELSEISKQANLFRARQNIQVKISKRQAMGLAKISKEQEMEPSEMAHKIVSDYLLRRGY